MAAAVMVLPFRGGVMYRWVFVCVCLAVVLCSHGVESAAKNEGLFKTTYLNETVDIHAPGVGDRYQDKLVLEQMKIIIESVKGTVVHYSLPMDTVHGRTIVNPSGLDASVSGSVVPSRGIVKNAIQVNGRDSYIRVTGPGHRSECFGDLDRCSLGYTLAFWVKFDHPISDGEHVYLSNGGDHHRSHGVAMLYNRGNMEFRFKKKNGQEWRAKSNNILPGRWYHVLATWGSTQGLMLYVNGELVDTTIAPVVRGSLVGNTTEFNDFLIGRPNDNAYSADRRRPISVDEFNFWSEFKTPEEVREAGPMYRYYLPMNSRPGLQMEDGNVKVAVGGNPKIVRGKMSSALEFDGRGDFISGDDLSATCLGDLSLCQYGILIGMWVRLDELHDSYIFSTGNKGVKLYVRDRRLVAEAQQGDNFWQTYRSVPDANRWYFIELAWNPTDGLALYADLKEVTRASTSRRSQPQSGNNHLNIGKSGQNLEGEKYASMVIDDLEMWYGDRSQLIDLEFISRGRPQMQHLNMDAISHNRVTHSNLTIDAYGQPRIIDGKIGGALNLDGNSQFVSLGNQHESCLGNLDLCHHGLLLSTWIRPGQLREGMDIFSSGANGIKAWYSGGRLHVSARTLTREWTLQTDKIAGNQWQFVEFEWDPKEGLLVYVNEQLAAQSSQPTVRLMSEVTAAHPDREKFYIGRGDGSRSNTRYANMTIDDVEYWYNNRKYLLAFDYIQRGKPERYHFDMDAIRDNKLVHSSLNIPVHGNPVIVPGKVNGAVRLDGNRQYLDVGDFLRACLGNMEYCNHGLAGSMWINFRSLHENAYYLSSGGGLRIYHSGGKLWVVVERSGKRWEVGVPNLKTDDWYFLEYSWHPEKGLQVFVNNKLVGEEKRSTSVTSSTPSGKVLIGSANSGDVPGGRYRYADAVIDEVETWYRDRENLIAFNYLLRDNITHIMFPLESQRGNRITHPDYTIIMYNGAVLVPGKVGNAVDLGGSGEYVDFGDQRQSCMGNLEMCPRGLTLSMDLNPRTLPNNGYILSAGPYSIYSRDGKIYAKFTYGTKTWLVETNKVRLNNWQKLEVSWDEQKGLQLYVNKEKVASTTDYTVLTAPPRVTDHIVYLGRPNEDETGGRYADAKIDELEFWYANRDLLQPDDAINHLIVDMSNITGGILVHPSRTIYIYGGRIIQGYSGNAILLNGHNQYIDVGGREVLCAGDLENCQKGFTLRFKISPNQLVDNTYFVSSAPVDVFYQNNRLVAEVRTPRFVWRTSTGNIRPNAWYQVDLSWHPVDGLVMYVNSERVDQQTTAVQNYAEYVIDKRFYLGRANTDMRYEFYADAVFDDLQVWEAKRDYLISIGVIKPDSDNLIGWTTMRPRLTTVATRRPRPPITIPSIPDYRKRLVFDGNGWIAYDFDQLPSNYLGRSDEERLVIKFQTSHPEGLLWYTGDEDNNMHLTIKDGFLYLVSTLDRGQHTDRVRIASNRLDDRAWHDVVLTRRDQQIFIEVDGKQYPAHRLSYDFSLVRPAQVYLGGSDRTSEITNYHISSNFYGKIREAILSGNHLPNSLDLKGLYLLRPGHVLVNRIGNIEEEDDEDERPSPPPAGRRPVTFITKHSHLRVPQWDAVQSGTLELNFKTAEPHGLILFNGGAAGRKDFVAVEVYDGLVFLVLNMGDGVQRFPFGTTYHKVDDDQPHYIRIERDHRNLRLTLDNDERRHSISGSDMNLDLGQVLFVGGRDHRDRLPWHVWTGDAAGDAIGEERKFFRGCVWDLKMNGGEPIDLESYVDQQTVTGTELDCRTAPIDCETNPCHNGTCTNRWDGFVCDCSKTEFTGKRCELRAPFLAFTGTDHLRINIQPTRRTHTNDISLRFRTPKEDGLLFGVSSSTSDAYLNVFLENGQIKLETNLGGKPRPVRLIVQCRYALNDYRWHTVYIRRRAHYLESWVDDCSKTTEELGGEGYGLNIDDILVGRFGENDSPKNSFVGYMQNFFFDKYRFFDYFLYGGQPADIRFGGTTNVTLIERPLPIHSVSFRDNPNAFLILPTLQIIGDTAIRLMFKTRERDGMILYNGGLGGDFFAMELVNGILHVSANDGSGARVVTSSAPPLNNNEWHIVEVIQVEPKKFNIVVDQSYVTEMFLPETRNTLDLTDRLYVGGIPESLRPRIPSIVVSKKGFVGCLASFTVNGRLYNLLTDATSSSVYVTPGCTDVTGFCAPGICRHGGICMEAVNGFFCDCNMTSFVGRLCEDEAEGYRIGEIYQPGITIYNFREAMHTNADKIALGFMTWHANGTLLRLDSTTTADFIEARLVNGHVIVMYDLGGGIRYLNETRRFFNDGNYHYLVFTRDGDDARLRIDDYPMIHHQSTDHGSVVFNGMVLAKIGGNLNERNQIIDYFNGIISSVYINGLRIVDLDVYYGDGYVRRRGDITIATHPFFVPRPPPPTSAPIVPPTHRPVEPTDPPMPPTVKPPIIIIPPITDKPATVPGGGGGGGGMGWEGENGGGGVIVHPNGGEPEVGALVDSGGVGGSEVGEGARAAAVAGAMIGVLALASSVVWAFYKFKPGLIGAGGGSPGLVISSPTSTTTPLLAAAGPAGGAAGAGGGGAVGMAGGGGGAGGGSASGMAVKTVVISGGGAGGGAAVGTGTGAAGGGGGGGAGMVNLSEHFQSISSSTMATGGAGAGGAGGAGGGSGTMHRGIQTDFAAGGGAGGAGGGGAQDQTISRSTIFQQDIRNVYNVDGGYGAGQGMAQQGMGQGMGTMQGQSAGGGYAAGYGSSAQAVQQGYNTLQSSSYAYDGSQGFAQNMVDGGYMGGSPQGQALGGQGNLMSSNLYEIQNMALGYSGFSQQELFNQQRLAHQRLMAASSASGGGPVPNLMAAEEIRVDCAKLTTNGRYVVTGSIFGPPQVWDLKTGDLVRVMKGEDFSSTDLHLANGDTLLVGQVAEMEQINPTDPVAKNRLHHRKLQIWDFESGHPLDMRRNELCTASCMMNDGERMLLGRTDKYGKNTVVIIWDILGNEQLRQITCDASVGFADYISYLNLSKDNRYVIAGFQNSHDHKANFITFDLSSSSAAAVSPKVMALDAQVEVTAILENHEAVTGTKGGELIIWSIRTGRELRQLVTPPAGTMSRREVYSQPAHRGEVKDVVVSKDGQFLVSASADRTVKLWNLELEKLVHTCVGHSDEVWCCTISNDNELLVSGSRDCTIRLWRADDGHQVAAIDAGMDVFRVMLSNNKKTIVALADRAASRKLIMLKVVRTKMKGSSRATSPRWQDGSDGY